MKKILKLTFVFVLAVFVSGSLFSNGLNLNGIGTKANSMGGAFIGLADDYSAVYWNPAGLTQMKDQSFTVYGSFLVPKGTYKFPEAGIDTETKSAVYPSGAIGYFKPLSDKLIIGFLGYVPAGSGAEWDGTALAALTGGHTYTWKSMIGMLTFSPVIAYKINDVVSIGATVNINYGILKLDSPGLGQYSENLTGTGYGATLGLMIKPSEKISLGLTYKTPTKVTAEGEATMTGAGLLKLTVNATAQREITWPMWFGAGIALKPMDKLTITADIQYTNWKELDKIGITYDNNVWNILFAGGATFDLNWEDRIQYRFGMEYMLSDALALRAGFYHDPTPAPVDTLKILLPQVDYNSITFGIGYNMGSLNLEFSFEYVMGKDRKCPLTSEEGMPGVHGMKILAPTVALSYRF